MARAVTTQMISLLGVAPERLDRLKVDEQLLSVEILGRHRNRLRPGHHAGNRFRLVIRDVATHAHETVPLVTDMLVRRGVPNYFGAQRFGARGDTASGNVTKVAKLETGIEVRVSLFIKEGEKVKVNTETRECLGRV